MRRELPSLSSSPARRGDSTTGPPPPVPRSNVAGSALLGRVPRTVKSRRRASVPSTSSSSKQQRTQQQQNQYHRRALPAAFDEKQQQNNDDAPDAENNDNNDDQQQQRPQKVRFDNESNNQHHASSTSLVPRFEPEVELAVKRRLGQENSSRIRLTRTLTQLEQELTLARKEHGKLQSRANSIPHYEQQLAHLRQEVEGLKDEVENLDIEYGFLQTRYRDVDRKLEPTVLPTVKNRQRLDSTVRESRAQQAASTAATLQKRERMLVGEIGRLEQQREAEILDLQQKLLHANELKPDDDLPSPARVRDAALKAALEKTREQHALHRGATLHAVVAEQKEEMKRLAEEEAIGQAQEAARIGACTNEVNKVETETNIKKHEVDELAARRAQATAHLAELAADIALEQQRLQQSQAALAPAAEEGAAVQARLESAKEHLERAALETRSQKTSAEQAAAAAAAAWGVEQSELERTVASLRDKVAALRQEEKALATELEGKRKERDDANAQRKQAVEELVVKHEKRVAESKRQSQKLAADTLGATATADKVEQEAANIEQRLQASQKNEIIMQLQRQHSEINSALENQIRSNAKLEEKLKSVLGQLGDEAAMI